MKPLTLILLFGVTATYGQGLGRKPLKILTLAQIDPSRLLPAPAPDGSATQKKEMAEVKRHIKTRTPERFAQAKWDAQHEDASMFAEVMGPAFAASTAKDYFRRKFLVTQESPETGFADWSCGTKVRKPSERPLRGYPSGHATLGYSLGIVLASLVPEKSQTIVARAADYAYSREVCGDHYHSDVEASHALGSAVGIMFLTNATLIPQIEASKAELRAAHLTPQ